MNAIINEFTREEVCVYKGRIYCVRDNGAVYRQRREDDKKSKWDEVWTFGKFDKRTGYMFIGQERVHRIVCQAYHGEPIGDRNYVDHIDINRCNNRPDNLRWVTKLENTLNNPITRAKVELICGSIENFLKNPELLYGHESENSNFTWMRAVSKEEGERSLKRWNEWAVRPVAERIPKGDGVGGWIYGEIKPVVELKSKQRLQYTGPYKSSNVEYITAVEEMNHFVYEKQFDIKDSLTPGSKQLYWKTPTEFPQTPQEITDTPLLDYLARLPKGAIYTRNRWGESPVYDAAMSEDGTHLSVVTKISGVTHYALAEVYFQDGNFVHKSIRTFFTEEGAQKYFAESLGREWTGGDVFEDCC